MAKLKINDAFDKIYCINLDKRTDRWEFAQAEFEKHGIVVERVSAIEGGAYGLVETNKKILQDAIDKCYNSILILEDDVEFVEDLQTRFDEAYVHVPEHWDILYFGGNHVWGRPETVNEYVGIAQRTLASHAIGYRQDAYQKMLDRLDNSIPIDVTFSNSLLFFNAFIFMPHLAWQKAGHSDIINSHVDYDFLR